jgi:YD repeat-containing protein
MVSGLGVKLTMLTAVTDPTGQQTQLAYNHAGQFISLTDLRTNVTHWTYDVRGRLTGMHGGAELALHLVLC